MLMIKYKKGQVGSVINKAIIGLISLTILLLLASQLIPEAQTAGNTLNASGVPLGSLFVGGGILFLIIVAGLFLTSIKPFMPK